MDFEHSSTKRERARAAAAAAPGRRERVLHDRHPRSKRVAVLEDHGSTLWLFLTEEDGATVACNVWVFHRGEPIAPPELVEPLLALPAPDMTGAPVSQDRLPVGGPWAFSWAADGEAVAVLREGQPVALARAARRVGFSRQVIQAGPWGAPWCETTFNELFGLKGDE